MKVTFGLFLISILTACHSMQQYTLTSDYDAEGRFESYVSYQIVDNQDISEEAREAIHSGINTSMRAMGYIEQSKSPVLYVYYQSYSDDIRVKSLEQANVSNMIARRPYFDTEISTQNQSKKIISGPSLMISCYDSSLGSTIWKGYAGQLHSRRLNIRSAAQLIISQFPVASSFYQSQENQYVLR